MNATLRLCVALALGIGPALSQNVPPPAAAQNRAAPQPGDADFPTPSPSARHDEKVAAVRSGQYDLVLIGDSITHTLGELGGKYEPLKQVWDRHFAPRHAINLGYSGYRTEQILWNLDNGELDFAQSPKAAILLIGTNNSDDRHFPKVHTPEEIFAGTKAIVDRIRQRHPTTKILVLRIFPRGGDAQTGVSPPAFNSSAQCIDTCQRAGELAAQLADGKQVFWLDINHVFLRPDGTINTDLMWDLLHPSPAGAEAWAQAIEPTLAQLMGDQPLTPLLAAAVAPQGVAANGATTPQAIPLWPDQAPVGDGTFEKTDAHVTLYRPAHPNGAAAVICPGGGYGGLVSGPEGRGIAQWLNVQGITGIVLEYRLPHGRAFVPLLDAQRALRLTRARASEWGLNPQRLGIIGFSAGGHLAATAATHFDAGDPLTADPLDRPSCRPDFAILVYPVITMGEKTHGGSRKNLLGPSPTPEMIEMFSNEKQVTDRTPPVFLAHALDDKVVSPEHSRMFYEALQAHHVPSRYLELPSGDHGLNGYKGPMWDAWQRESLLWLASLKLIPEPHRVISRGEAAASYQAFPDICRLNNGDLFCVFYAGYGHISLPKESFAKGGRICSVRSKDEGVTWSAPQILFDSPSDDRDPHIAQMRDGTVVCSFFTYRPQAGGQVQCDTCLVTSRDGGESWEPEPHIVAAGWPSSAPVRELADGTRLLGVYHEDGTTAYGGVIRSTDGGQTWSAPVPIGQNSGVRLDAETDFVVLKDGTLYAALRGDRVPMHFATSTDEGLTWSPAKDIGFPGHCPHFTRLRSGVILLSHRLPLTALHISRDEAKSWEGPYPIDTTPGAYPSTVELKDGSVLIVYYEEGDRSAIRARRFAVEPDGIEFFELPPVGSVSDAPAFRNGPGEGVLGRAQR